MSNSHETSRWEVFFDGHAPEYMRNSFTSNTECEVEFIVSELKLGPGSTILDVGCGTGRHTVGLAKRGYRVTGVDLSSGMLAEARKAAEDANVSVELIHCDATGMGFNTRFDGAICICQGAFGLLGQNDDPFRHDMDILERIHAALKPAAGLILGALNGTEKIRRFSNKDVTRGLFDPLTLVETFTMEYDEPEGRKSIQLRERGYIASELMLMLGQAGFEVEHIWGGTAGGWRKELLDLDEIEIMIIARAR